MANDLMAGKLGCLNAQKTLNCDEEKYGPLDQNPTVGCQEHNAAQSI